MSERLQRQPAPPVPSASTVLVTGGSRGLGLAVVHDLLSRGLRVATFARSLTPELKTLQAQHGHSLCVSALDLGDLDAVATFMDDAAGQLGPFDGLVGNAATGQDSLLVHTAPHTIETLIANNLTKPLLLLRMFARRLLHSQRPGRVVSITSVVTRRAYPGLAVYAASKAGMEAATLVLAQEARGRILANCVAPGFFDSDMSAVLNPEQRAAIARRIATGRLMQPSHVVPIVRMLLTEAIEMNGQTILVDGGARA